MDPHQPGNSNQRGTESRLRNLRGVVERITFQNPENGFTVARLAAERGGDETTAAQADARLVTLIGTLPDLQPGDAIAAQGWWQNVPRHGWQFQAIEYRTTLPATVQGMKRYLGSGLVKGIGPGQRIAATWDEQRHVREVMAALQGYGVSTSLAVRIYKEFGDDSARVISQEPYRLAREVWGIGFRTADKIAQAVGIAPDAPQRLQAGVLHALGQSADEGHTLLPEETLLTLAGELLEVGAPALAEAIAALLTTGELVAGTKDGEVETLFALAPFARAETGLASRLQALAVVRK